MADSRRTRTRAICGTVGLVCACAALTGCYHRVTRAEGFGADRITTEEPNLKQGPLDSLIFGQDKPPKRSSMPQ